ncbi:glycosyl transferase [Epibacterium sp. SM1969]|uniref:Peptide O-xylosyltransferase n=1 Tax=Tritonibacter aquimaris TaxID=2663379 RepID=A0A844AVH5_9RHOB|nr:glycosyl transferase [Tritonibacter aquimaris]
MSTLGIVMLVHTALPRAAQVARHWTAAGCPVVIHVDRKVAPDSYNQFVKTLSDDRLVSFCKRHRCEWGGWGLVAASQAGAEQMLKSWPEVGHVYLTSGSCLPLRPICELQSYLSARAKTDFIESATTADVPWTVGGLSAERFTLRFPFSWKKRRALFDGYVNLQRRIGFRRRIPAGLVPHMGSQWWCLTRKTLSAILNDADREIYESYFRRVWIPDESYFQSLARLHSVNIESRSLTLSKFDYQGKPHVFYDDHLHLLRRSDCFVARKIWPQAGRLYQAFLTPERGERPPTEPNPRKIDRVFEKAVERRTRGRAGLYMQSRQPREGMENGISAANYSVFQGFSELFDGFEHWLEQATKSKVHGHLFAPERVEFAEHQSVYAGALSDSAALRDYDCEGFLTNLIWNTRGERQCFQFGPRDTQGVAHIMARDTNAQISVISGAWAVPLFKSGGDFDALRREAARLQSIEAEHLRILRSHGAKARIRIWSMAEFIEMPSEALQVIVDEITLGGRADFGDMPKMVDLDGFGQFLQNLKNQGMHPYLMGDFPIEPLAQKRPTLARKAYVVR